MAQVSYGAITITDITDIENVQNWYLATDLSSGVTKSNPSAGHGTWTTNIENATLTSTFQYLWNYEKILGTGNVEISSTQPIIIGHFGINGTNGIDGVDGNSIISIDEYYQTTNSTTNPGSSGWQKNTIVIPTSSQRYLWNYQVVNYSKTTPEGSYNEARIIGVYGERGTSILKITTAPTPESSQISGFTYSYKISTSIVKTQSGKGEVLIGDIIEYNSNHYRVVYVNSNNVYLSSATSIKGADGQTYYTHILYSSKSSPTSSSDVDGSPSGKTYVAIQITTNQAAPAWDDAGWVWMKYIGTDGEIGPQGISVTNVRELYYLKTNNTVPSPITWNSSTSQPSQTIYSTDRQNSWTSVVPTYVNVTGAIYYTCIETSLSNNTKAWSAPAINNALTNANQKALEAYNTSIARDTEVNALKAQAKYYWWDSQGAHIAAGLTSTDSDANITHSQPSTYGFNSLMSPSALKLRYQDIDFAQLATNRLTFFRPATNGSTYVQGKKAMDLTADALTFYEPLAYNSSNEPTAAATLSSTGLNIVDGSITLGSTFSVNRNGELTATAGSIGGWTIDSNSIHSSNKNVWDKDVDGIFIGNHTVEEELIFTISGGKIQYVEADETEVNPETTYYVLDGDTYIKVIDIEPTDNPRHKGWYKDLGPMWYINSDGSASFGSLLVNQTGSLDVPAASISGLLTANQIEVDTLWAGNTTIGATIDSDFTSNTIEANSKLVMLSTTDTRAIDGKDYYGTIYSYEEVNSDGYYQLTEDEEVVEGKNYYSKNSDGIYSRVSSPAGDPSLQGWYELVSPSKETYYEKILVNELEDYYPERSFLAKGDNAASGSIAITNFPSNEILISYRFLNNETIREHTFHYGYPETFSDSMSQVVVNIIYDGSKEFTIEGNLVGGAIINAEYETYILSNDIIANIEKTYYMLKEETSIITGAIVSPYASGYEEKIKQSYISLKTEKVDYILTKDSLVKENKSYYYYNYEYVFTKDTEVNKESIYYKTIKIKTDDVEPNDNKTYYYKNNSNNYIAIDWINNSSLYVLTEDTTIVAGKNYYIKNANDEYIIVSNPTGNPKEQNWYEYLDTLYEDKMQIVTPLELIGDNINPFENGWLEKVASYILVNNPSGNPQTNDYYEVQSIASAELVLENGNIFIKSNENTVLSTDSSEGDINITSADILGDIGFGNILLMPFENGFIVQTKE